MESRRAPRHRSPLYLLLALGIATSLACADAQAVTSAVESAGQVLSERTRYYSVVTQSGEIKHYRANWSAFLTPGSGGTGKSPSRRCGLVTTRRSLTEIAYPSLAVVRDALPPREQISDLIGNEDSAGKCPKVVRLRAIIARYLQSRAALNDSLLEAELTGLSGPSRQLQSWVFPEQIEIRFSPGDPDAVLNAAYRALRSFGVLPTRTVAFDTDGTLAANLRRWDVVFNRATQPLEDLLGELNADNSSITVRTHHSGSKYLVISKDRPVWLVVPDVQWKAVETIQEMQIPSSTNLAAFLVNNGLYRAQLSGRNVPLPDNKAKTRRIFELNRDAYAKWNIAADDLSAVLNAANARMKLPLDTVVLPFPRSSLQRLMLEYPSLASQISDVADPTRTRLNNSPTRTAALAPAAAQRPSPADCADPGQLSFGRNLEAIGVPARRPMTSAAPVFIFDSFSVPSQTLANLDRRRRFIKAYYSYLRTKADYQASIDGAGFHVTTQNVELLQSLDQDYCGIFQLTRPVCDQLEHIVKERAEAFSAEEIADREFPRNRSILDELNANPEFLADARRYTPAPGAPGQLKRDGNHGYHVAGIIGARCNGYGFAGAAAGVGLVPYPIASAADPPELSSITFENLARAIDAVAASNRCYDSAPCIVNISATEQAGNISKGFIRSVSDLKNSVLVVGAAGENADNDSCRSANPAVPTCIGYPFRTNVLTVAAGQLIENKPGKPRKQLMPGSGHGPHVALIAPGDGVLSIGRQGNFLGSGTSQASAFVTGLAAAIQSSGTWSATAIAERLLYTVDLDSGIPASRVSFGWVNAQRALARDPRKDWVAVNGGDPMPGVVGVTNRDAQLYLYSRSSREPTVVIKHPASVRRIFRDRSKKDFYSYVVIYRDRYGEYTSPAQQIRDPNKTAAQELNCGLKIVRDVYFLPLGPDNIVQGTDSMCGSGSWNCPLKIFEFTPAGGDSQILRLPTVDDMIVKIGANVDHPESGECL
jgi:hypothetical protein